MKLHYRLLLAEVLIRGLRVITNMLYYYIKRFRDRWILRVLPVEDEIIHCLKQNNDQLTVAQRSVFLKKSFQISKCQIISQSFAGRLLGKRL